MTGKSLTFEFDKAKRKEVFDILNNTKLFINGGSLGGFFHRKDVGGKPTLTIDLLRVPSGVSVFPVVVDTNTLKAYADIDRYNPYQDVANFLGHWFLEVVPWLAKRLFGG
jgi:hypothetical protein